MRVDAMTHYGITRDFRDAGFFETSVHKRLFDEIKIAIRAGGLIAISGMVGSGKTVMLRKLQDHLTKGGRIIVSRSLSVEKQKVQLATLIAALFYDLSPLAKDARIPSHGERRERELRDLIRQGRKPVALFVDEAHDLPRETLKGLKRLFEVVKDGGGALSIVLAGHPKLKNDLARGTMEEIGCRTSVFNIDEAILSKREYIEWLLAECSLDDVEPHDILKPDAIDLLSERLNTPLQIEQHLKLALEAGHDADEKPITATLVESILSRSLSNWEAALTRNGYDQRALAGFLNVPHAEVRQLLRGELEPLRTKELHEKLLVVGLPIK